MKKVGLSWKGSVEEHTRDQANNDYNRNYVARGRSSCPGSTQEMKQSHFVTMWTKVYIIIDLSDSKREYEALNYGNGCLRDSHSTCYFLQ